MHIENKNYKKEVKNLLFYFIGMHVAFWHFLVYNNIFKNYFLQQGSLNFTKQTQT